MAPTASGSPTCLGRSRDSCTAISGGPGDKVHSELHHGLDVRKVTGRHIFDHLEHMVETDCWIGPDRRVRARPPGWRVSGFYVHPRSGLLCFVSRPSARERKKERLLRQYIDEVRIDHRQSYKLLDGQWYLVEYEWVEIARRESHLRWDVVERKQVRLMWGDHRVAIGKRQSNREGVHWIRARIAAGEKQVRRM